MDTFQKALKSKEFWYLDLALSLLYGAGLGYEVQRLADSGERIPEKILIISATGFCSFLTAFIISILLKKWRPDYLYWVSTAIMGSVVFSFLYGIVWFTYNSVGHSTVSEILSDNAGFFASRIIFQSVFFATPLLVLLALFKVLYFYYLRSQYKKLD
jgi:ABC-type branched-subunit amino acid transport system permease subunit